jgi:hypothetical protein
LSGRLLALLVAAGAAASCSSVPPLDSQFRTPDVLAAAVLDAVAANDRARLDRLALGEREFKDHVWPDLPAARPERNLPFSYVWGDLHQKSNNRLVTTLREHAGKRYSLRRVRFGDTTSYAHYRVHRDSVFDVVDASGIEASLRVCGSFLEKDGVWKVFSYAVDD